MTLLSLLMYFSLDPVFNINMITLAFLWLAFVRCIFSFKTFGFYSFVFVF